MERENNNAVIAVVITVLVMIILGFVAYFVYDKFLINDNNEPNVEENDNKEENKVTYTDYDLDAAKELVYKYIGVDTKSYGEPSFFDGVLTDGEKIDIVGANLENIPFKRVSCESLFGGNDNPFDNSCAYCVGDTAVMTYSSVNKHYQKMFGIDTNAPKTQLRLPPNLFPDDLLDPKFGVWGAAYDKKTDQFVAYYNGCGGDAPTPMYMHEVISAEIDSNQNIVIEVSAVGFILTEYNDNVMIYESTYDKAITYNELEDISDNYIKENPDKVHKFTFKFKKENDHYIFDSLTKQK